MAEAVADHRTIRLLEASADIKSMTALGMGQEQSVELDKEYRW